MGVSFHQRESLEALRSLLESLLESMQTPAAQKGMEEAFNASQSALGQAAVKAAQRRR